jgi:hypothetical protein
MPSEYAVWTIFKHFLCKRVSGSDARSVERSTMNCTTGPYAERRSYVQIVCDIVA